ncbi:MAG: hypothetical protein GX639_09790 [Fibrobacter sp.]|nr:hypothetical protein [Fibrobacter sp.]
MMSIPVKKISGLCCAACVFLVLFNSFSEAQDESRPWERLGLSQTEWRLINENNISMPKLEQLLNAGISVGEYIQKPWEPLEMNEDKWIKKRRSGLTSYDIELEATRGNAQEWKKTMNYDVARDMQQLSGNGELFSSLFLPGYYQYHVGQKRKSYVMAGLAGGALAWFTIGCIANKRVEVAPIALVIVPDMIWSFIDYKIDKKNKNQ